jgi:hypothetical protein
MVGPPVDKLNAPGATPPRLGPGGTRHLLEFAIVAFQLQVQYPS